MQRIVFVAVPVIAVAFFALGFSAGGAERSEYLRLQADANAIQANIYRTDLQILATLAGGVKVK